MNKTYLMGSMGIQLVDRFNVSIGLLLNKKHESNKAMHGSSIFLIENIAVCEFDNAQSDLDLLIGRDIICRGCFTISLDGHFTFSF